MNYKTLPRGYVYAGNLDFMRNRAQMKIVVVLSLALLVVPALAGLLIAPVGPGWRLLISRWWAGSTVWFDRRSHIITALAPVVVWGAILQIAIAKLPGEWFWPLWIVQISNLSGSAGDLYTAWALMRMEGDLLIQDTGVRMRVMKKKPIEETEK